MDYGGMVRARDEEGNVFVSWLAAHDCDVMRVYSEPLPLTRY